MLVYHIHLSQWPMNVYLMLLASRKQVPKAAHSCQEQNANCETQKTRDSKAHTCVSQPWVCANTIYLANLKSSLPVHASCPEQPSTAAKDRTQLATKHSCRSQQQRQHQSHSLVVVSCECVAEPVVVVHHAGHAVKAVAVKLVLIHPPAGVAQQEAHRLPVACSEGRQGKRNEKITQWAKKVKGATPTCRGLLSRKPISSQSPES